MEITVIKIIASDLQIRIHRQHRSGFFRQIGMFKIRRIIPAWRQDYINSPDIYISFIFYCKSISVESEKGALHKNVKRLCSLLLLFNTTLLFFLCQ